MSTYQKKSTIPDPDIGSGDMVNSSVKPEGGSSASAEELAKALEVSLQRIAALESQVTASKSNESDSINKLAEVLQNALKPNQSTQVPEADNTNRSTDFKNSRATLDGQAMMDAQMTLGAFKSEVKHPISIPKSFANFVGANLDITVNGARVSIPCDGKTYYINETHWIHAKERIAKIDLQNANNEPQVVTING